MKLNYKNIRYFVLINFLLKKVYAGTLFSFDIKYIRRRFFIRFWNRYYFNIPWPCILSKCYISVRKMKNKINSGYPGCAYQFTVYIKHIFLNISTTNLHIYLFCESTRFIKQIPIMCNVLDNTFRLLSNLPSIIWLYEYVFMIYIFYNNIFTSTISAYCYMYTLRFTRQLKYFRILPSLLKANR